MTNLEIAAVKAELESLRDTFFSMSRLCRDIPIQGVLHILDTKLNQLHSKETPMETPEEARADRAVTIYETRRKDLVRLAIKDSKYTYLLEEVLVSGSSPDLEGLLLAIATDVADCAWF